MMKAIIVFALALAGLALGQPAAKWRTDLSKRSIELSELKSGGPGKDGIPALADPKFEAVAKAGKWIDAKEPVIVVAAGEEVRIYPVQILIWHELVNDEIAGVPILVSYCPLCNSTVVFDRRIDGEPHEFGVSGMLRESDMVMFDRDTESLWQQISGEALVGTYTGKRLTTVPSQTVPFEVAARQYQAARVLSRNTGYSRQYGRNPYAGYEFGNQLMFPVRTPSLRGARLLERLVAVSSPQSSRAYPFAALRKSTVVAGEFEAGSRYVIFYSDKAKSALDAERLADSRDVGAVGVFAPEVEGEVLSFKARRDGFVDEQTGSTWNLLGAAIAGPLVGKQLKPFPHIVSFTFAWLVFNPRTEIVRPEPTK
ncbi:MAG: DUF3179 domain-containing protein [Bryobacteraceae bacterium]